MNAVQQKKDEPLKFACINSSCGTLFERRAGGRATCSRACAKAVERAKKAPKLTAREKKIQRRKERLLECPFGYWLLGAPVRAGSMQTYQGVTAEHLHELQDLHNYRKKRYGWVEPEFGRDDYAICHIQPLSGRDGSIGLTTPDNLFVGLAQLNSSQSDKPVSSWAGASIPKSARKRKWDVTPDMKQADILQLLADFLGDELDIFLDEMDKMPQRTVRLKLARSIFKRQSDDSGLYEPLSRRYTLDELNSMTLEQLQELEEIQAGMKLDRSFILGNCPPDSALGVLHDQLQMKVDSSSAGKDGDTRYRDNCAFMLKVVKATGLYLAQVGNPLGKARNRFLYLAHADWTPFHYLYHSRPWNTPADLLADDLRSLLYGVYDAQGKAVKPGIIPTAQNALQGLEIDQEYMQNRLLKRLVLRSLVPVVDAPDQWSWEACGSNWLGYIDNLYDSLEPVWQSLLDLDLCTDEQITEARDGVLWNLNVAVERARQRHRNQPCFTQWNVRFERYPQWLEFPPVWVEPYLPSSATLSLAA